MVVAFTCKIPLELLLLMLILLFPHKSSEMVVMSITMSQELLKHLSLQSMLTLVHLSLNLTLQVVQVVHSIFQQLKD
jgi:hypothetical protein